MSLRYRSLTAAAVVALTFSGLGVSASAEELAPVVLPEAGRPVVDQPAQVSRGLIVKTTTATPSDSLLRATEDALDSEAEVTDDDLVIPKVSTVDFDEIVPASVASDAAEEIEKRSDVVWAIPDTLRKASSNPPVTVDDPYFPTQTNLWNTGVTSPSGGYSTKAPSLWRKTTGSSAVTVAVVDTGITQHPDLAGQVVSGYDMISDVRTGNDGDGRDADASDPGDWVGRGFCGPGEPAESSSWHGTFVAGMIAAQAGNAEGIAGIAPGVKIRPVRVLGRCGGWDSDILAGITWASGGQVSGVPVTPSAAQVVNLSLGGYTDSTAERDSICQAYNAVASAGRARGSLFVAAAGNNFGNANLAVPASCPEFISVAATSAKGFSSSYSNVGSSVDLSAPGGDSLVEGSADRIRSLINTSATSPGPSFSTALYEGTSMAAPEVSAGAALLYSLGLETPESVQNALYASIAPFPARSSTYAAKRVWIDGAYYTMDLNCSGHTWCGRGILDLSKVQTPLAKPTISGTPTIGEPLTAVTGTWVKTPTTPAYQWFRGDDSIPGATGATYYPTHDDVDKQLSVRMSPTTAAYSMFSTTSEPTVPLPDGPEVTMTGLPTTTRYAQGATATVTVTNGGSPVDGVVELRRGSTVLASQATTSGTAQIPIGGTQWVIGSNRIRAAFVADGTTPAASSEGTTITVNKAISSVTTSLRTSVRYTLRATIGVVVKVTNIPKPTGELRVYDGSRRIVTTTLYSSQLGKRAILLPRLSKGYHLIKVVYMGNSFIASKTSAVRRIKSY